MRTAQFLAAGLLLLAGFLWIGRLFAGQLGEASRVATWAFVVVWFLVAAANMWVGVAKAGYSATEELPVFLLIFGVPAAVAVLVQWRFA